MRGRGIGAATFSAPSTTCPAGSHYVPDTYSASTLKGLKGIGACVPNTVLHLTLRPAAAAPATAAAAPPPLPPLPPAIETTPAPTATSSPAPPQPDTAAAPAPTPAPVIAPAAASCPTPYPWWWLVVAAGVGALGGHYVRTHPTATKRNLGRIVNAAGGRMIARATDTAVVRLLG